MSQTKLSTKKTTYINEDTDIIIEQFLDNIWLEQGLSANTLSSYRLDLQALGQWLAHHQLDWLSVTTLDLQSFLATRLDEGYKASSAARLLSTMRRLFQYLYREKLRLDDPSSLLSTPKLPKRLPKDLSERQVDDLLNAPCIDEPLELRDKAMLEVLYACGLRVSELVGLSLSDISLRQGVLRVIGKGDKERLVPLGEEAIYWLEQYLQYGRPTLMQGKTDDIVFPSLRGQKMTRQNNGRKDFRNFKSSR